MHVFEIDLQRAKIRRRKLAGQIRLCAIDDGVINPTMQFLRLRISRNIQTFRQEIGVARGSFLHFTALDSSIGEWNFFYGLELVLIRNPQHRSDQILFLAPR